MKKTVKKIFKVLGIVLGVILLVLIAISSISMPAIIASKTIWFWKWNLPLTPEKDLEGLTSGARPASASARYNTALTAGKPTPH